MMTDGGKKLLLLLFFNTPVLYLLNNGYQSNFRIFVPQIHIGNMNRATYQGFQTEFVGLNQRGEMAHWYLGVGGDHTSTSDTKTLKLIELLQEVPPYIKVQLLDIRQSDARHNWDEGQVHQKRKSLP